MTIHSIAATFPQLLSRIGRKLGTSVERVRNQLSIHIKHMIHSLFDSATQTHVQAWKRASSHAGWFRQHFEEVNMRRLPGVSIRAHIWAAKWSNPKLNRNDLDDKTETTYDKIFVQNLMPAAQNGYVSYWWCCSHRALTGTTDSVVAYSWNAYRREWLRIDHLMEQWVLPSYTSKCPFYRSFCSGLRIQYELS